MMIGSRYGVQNYLVVRTVVLLRMPVHRYQDQKKYK